MIYHFLFQKYPPLAVGIFIDISLSKLHSFKKCTIASMLSILIYYTPLPAIAGYTL